LRWVRLGLRLSRRFPPLEERLEQRPYPLESGFVVPADERSVRPKAECSHPPR
jgi:hypothetical protein